MAVRVDHDAERDLRNARRNVRADRGVLDAWQRAHRPQHFPDRRHARRQVEARGVGQHQLDDEGAIRIGASAVGHQPEQRARNQTYQQALGEGAACKLPWPGAERQPDEYSVGHAVGRIGP
jgi:hypothetical protein